MKSKVKRAARHLHVVPPDTATTGGEPQASALVINRDRLILDHLALVKAIALNVYKELPIHVELDDLTHAGVLGLFDAAQKFDPAKQTLFSSYARYRIKGAILDSLRKLDWASRDVRRRHRQLEAVRIELGAKLQRAPTEAETADALGLDVRRFRKLVLALHCKDPISNRGRAAESEREPVPELHSGPETQPDLMCIRRQIRTALSDAVKTLPVRHQKIVKLYYPGQMTMKEISGILGINQSRVSQILKAARQKMGTVLRAGGITSQAF